MTMFKVESGIELPAKPKGGHGAKYPFAKMEPGQSFLLPTDSVNNVSNSAAKAASYWGSKLGRKFTTRRVEGGVRVWRVQ